MRMHKTYVTRMPDKAGAFLVASRIISGYGGNIVRVNYNKAVDTHTLFIEVSADENQHRSIEHDLKDSGYLSDADDKSRILMIVLTLQDMPGAVTPILDILVKHNVNISYMSSQENGTGVQHFKMGLFLEDSGEMTKLIEEISQICEIKILNYEVTDRLLDGTVFYVSFANEMRDILKLSQEETNDVLICANRLMQQMDEQGKPVLQTFDYIRRFAEFVRSRKGAAFNAKVSTDDLFGGFKLHVIEPPCGSNTFILQHDDELMFFDCGFACYRDEMMDVFNSLFPNFSSMRKSIVLTHADVDHTGILDLFDKIYLNQNCYNNFKLEHEGRPNFREQNPKHEPYCFLSKVISEYTPAPLNSCIIIGDRKDKETMSYIGYIEFAGVVLDCYEGLGGHVKGEMVIVCRNLKLVFSGDIMVNVKGFSPEQREFNSLAPFLMTGVDIDAALCKKGREKLLSDYPGYLFCPGHGAVFTND